LPKRYFNTTAMPTPNHEPHTGSPEKVRDIIIGMSDGLTVPFALAAGLTGAISASHLVITAGLAEIAAGSISMGLGGYLAARSEAEHYMSERLREEREIREVPEIEAEEVASSLMEYGLSRSAVEPVVRGLQKNPTAWVNFMMRNELGLEQPNPKRAITSALTIATAYIVGGSIPLIPYALLSDARVALFPSAAVTALALGIFGFYKGRATGVNAWRSALQTMVIGGIAAGVAFALARLIS
jgi:VIT1/CCC1 family predicted Fe2+/Mn2+ transporter